MITHQVINLLGAPVTHIAHQANCFHIMGGGVARAIRSKYPEAYVADLSTVKGSKDKLGTFSRTVTTDDKIIYNVYSQYNLSAGIGDRATQYDMVYEGLKSVEQDITLQLAVSDMDAVLGIPYLYGCVLGGGSWRVVDAIIHDIFESSPVNVLLCEWPPKQNATG